MRQRFPSIAYPELAEFLREHQVSFFRQAKGSHEVWKHAVTGKKTTVVNHGKRVIKRRTLKEILAPVGLSVDDIIAWRQRKKR